MPPRQFDAAATTGVPRTYNDVGEQNVGASGVAAGFTSFQAGLPADASKLSAVTNQTYPYSEGSYAGGEQQADGNGAYTPGSADNPFESVKITVAEGTRLDNVDYPGFTPTGKPLNASGITHTTYANPNPPNVDPFLDADV